MMKIDWELYSKTKDRLIVKTVDTNDKSIFVLKNLSNSVGQPVIVTNKDGGGTGFLKAQSSYRVVAARDSNQSFSIVTTGTVYLKVLCFQKRTVQLLLPHQEKIERGPKFDLDGWLLLKKIPDEFGAVRTFVHNSCLKNHTLTRDWYLTMSIFVIDDNSVTKRGKLYMGGEEVHEVYELLYLGGILNIFQTAFYDEWCAYKGYGNDKPDLDVLFAEWSNAHLDEIFLVEERAVEKTFEVAGCLRKDEGYGGYNFSQGFSPTGKKRVGEKGVGWEEVCEQVTRKTEEAVAAATAAAAEAIVGQLDGLEDDESVDESFLDEVFGDNASPVSLFV